MYRSKCQNICCPKKHLHRFGWDNFSVMVIENSKVVTRVYAVCRGLDCAISCEECACSFLEHRIERNCPFYFCLPEQLSISMLAELIEPPKRPPHWATELATVSPTDWCALLRKQHAQSQSFGVPCRPNHISGSVEHSNDRHHTVPCPHIGTLARVYLAIKQETGQIRQYLYEAWL